MSYFEDNEKDRAKAEQVWDKVLEEMLVLYYPPFRADDAVELADQTVLALRAYVEDLMQFDWDVLRDAWRDVRRTHKTQGWPTIQSIREACKINGSPPPSGWTASGGTSRKLHEDFFRKTGQWYDHWGPQPAAVDDGGMRARDLAAKTRSRLTPEQRERADEAMRRYRNGESISKVLGELWAGDTLAMPLLPGERMSQERAEQVRRDRATRADEEWPG